MAELIEGAIANNYTLANSQLDIGLIAIDQQKLNDAYLPKLAINGKEGFAFSSIYVKTPNIGGSLKYGANFPRKCHTSVLKCLFM